LERSSGADLTDTVHAVVCVLSEASVLRQDAPEARGVEMATVDELANKLSLDNIMPPLTSESLKALKLQRMDGGLENGVIAPVRRVVVSPILKLDPCPCSTLPGFIEKRSAELDHVTSFSRRQLSVR